MGKGLGLLANAEYIYKILTDPGTLNNGVLDMQGFKGETGKDGKDGSNGVDYSSLQEITTPLSTDFMVLLRNGNPYKVSIERSYMKTTDRLLIDEDGKALLPSEAIGDIVCNMAMIFDSPESSVIEKEVTVTTDGIYAYFDISDNISDKYCIMSYLTYKVG